MAIISASNNAQLLSALKIAQAGDTISLAYGKYGSLNLDGTKYATNYLKYSGEVKIVSADSSRKAVIDSLTLTGVTNLTFEKINFDYSTANSSSAIPFNVNSSKNITFRGDVFGGEFSQDGFGLGTGLKVSQGNAILIENSTFAGFRKGIEAWAVTGLTVQNNAIKDISYDGLVTGHVQGLTIKGNTITMKSNPGEDEHRDGIQIWNQGDKAPSSGILIEKNTITSTDTTTHGIYMGNADAKSATNFAEFYSDVTIRDNVIMTGQKLGIAVGQTDGLTINGNTLIQNASLNDNSRSVTIPLIHVEQDAVNVTITGNILHGGPVVANVSWAQVIGASPAWTIDDNAIVKLNWNAGDPTGDPWAAVRGNGQPDEFRFKGTWVATADRTDVNDDISFEEGDTIVFTNYQDGSFKGVWQGNALNVNTLGNYAKIDSMVDLQELSATSPKVAASVRGDTLTLDITQTGGVHHIVLEGLGEEFLATYDSTLF